MANQFNFEVGQIFYRPHTKNCYKVAYFLGDIPYLEGCDILGDTGLNRPFETTGKDDVYFHDCVLITDENCIEYSRKVQAAENLQRACDLLWNLDRMHGIKGLVPIIKQLQAIQP